MIVDLFFVYQFIKRLATPFNKWNAYNLNIIDDKGNIIKSRKDLTTRDEKESFTLFDNLVLKIKKLLNTIPGGESKIGTYAAALWLLKEHHNRSIEDINEDTFKTLVEEVAANNVGGGNIAGVGVGVDGEPGIKKRKKHNVVIGTIKRNNP